MPLLVQDEIAVFGSEVAYRELAPAVAHSQFECYPECHIWVPTVTVNMMMNNIFIHENTPIYVNE